MELLMIQGLVHRLEYFFVLFSKERVASNVEVKSSLLAGERDSESTRLERFRT